MPTVLLLVPLVCLLAGAVLAALLGRRTDACLALGYGATALAGAFAAGAGVGALVGAPTPTVRLLTILPGTAIALHLTPLGAAFWVVIGLPVCAVSIYAAGYARHYAPGDTHARPGTEGVQAHDPGAQGDHHGARTTPGRYSLGALGSVFNLFVAALLLVVSATDALGFLLAWEAMALLSYLLVVYDHRERPVVRAGLLYAVMTHAGTACIIVCFLILGSSAPGGSLSFDAFATAGRHLSPGAATLVFLLALLGFGTKAGVMPLHVWLPRAHPVAPSHVSALMSGVMLKTALYGTARVAFDLLGPASGAPSWWGWLVLAVGLLSAVLGVLYALMEHDLKRLLAYHSVENVGIILIGLGAALVLASYGLPAIAGLALAAGLFHTVNHALFKSLLFVGAGAVDQATHTRSLEHLGGLIRPMPQTAALFLVGAMAISALPPLNGFASEWLTFQALLGLAGTGLPAVEVGGLVGAALLALTSGLAAACFVKAFGVTFLGLPRSGHVPTGESPWTVRAGMALLAAACAVLGLFPGAASAALGSAAALAGQRSAPTTDLGGTRGAEMLGAQLVDGLRQTHVQPSLALGVALLVAVGAWVVLRALGPVPVRRGVVWVCGFDLVPAMQYGSTAFAETIRLFFRRVLRPERHLTTAEWALAPYFPARLTTRGGTPALIERHLYTPTMHALLRLANQLRAMQNGSLRYYLLYVFGTLLVLLVLTR